MSGKNLLGLFKEKVKEIPNNLAIEDQYTKYTYKELDIITDKVAFYLKERGIKQGSVVPLLLKPSVFTIVSIFSIYKLGAAYLPISTKFPSQRVQYLLNESGSSIYISDLDGEHNYNQELITLKQIQEETKNTEFKELEIVYGELAYILYTSGSTGNPKGVKISHSNVFHILNNMQKFYPVGLKDSYLLTTPYTFDVSVVELFGWILGGGKLVISNSESTEGLRKLVSQISEYNITHLALSPSILNMVLNVTETQEIKSLNKNLKFLMIAGEEFKPNLARKVLNLLPDVQVDNLYGPTETTIYATRYTLNSDDIKDSVPIGKELDNVKTLILNKKKEEVQFDREGELYIGGKGVAVGYHNLPDETRDNFTVINGELFYSTGDLCKRLKNGNIVFIGRIDSQVQINGIRVELGEIENSILTNISNIDTTKIIFHENKLCCFYKLQNQQKKVELKELLDELLPSYMVPNVYIRVDEFPLNVNGKINEKDLITQFIKNNPIENNEKLNTVEKKVRSIFSKVLEKKESEVRSTDDFFEDLGGDSLDNITCLLKLEAQLDVSLDDGFLYRNPTIKSIGKYIVENPKNDASIFSRDPESDTVSYLDKNQIEKSITESRASNTKVLQNLQKNRLYSSYYLQKVYLIDDFSSTIDLELNFDYYSTIETIKESCVHLINNNELLRTVLIKNNEKIYFEEYENLNDIDIPVFDLTHINHSNTLKKSINEIKECLSLDITNNILNNLLYRFSIIKTKENYQLLMVLSHHIADYSNIHIIKKELFNKDKSISKKNNYKDFIDFVNENSDLDNVMTDAHTKDLAYIGKQDLSVKTVDGLLALRTKKSKDLNTANKIISYINYLTSQLICQTLNKEKIAISTIYNIRNLGSLSFEDCIGDYHSSITLYGVNNENITDFYTRTEQLIDQYKSGYNPMNAIFKTYPIMNKQQKKLEEIYDLNPSVKTNYIGELRGEAIRDLYESLDRTKQQLSKFPVSKVYVTCYSTKDYIHLIFLSKPDLNETIINELGLTILNTTELV